jgi:hypothetical protein
LSRSHLAGDDALPFETSHTTGDTSESSSGRQAVSGGESWQRCVSSGQNLEWLYRSRSKWLL